MLFKFVVSGPFVSASGVGCRVCCHLCGVPRVCACFPQFVVGCMLNIKLMVGDVLRVFVARTFHVSLVVPASPFCCVACCNGMVFGCYMG